MRTSPAATARGGALLAGSMAADDPGLEVLPVQGNVLHDRRVAGGNTTVQIGPEAVVVVDTKHRGHGARSCSRRSGS